MPGSIDAQKARLFLILHAYTNPRLQLRVGLRSATHAKMTDMKAAVGQVQLFIPVSVITPAS